MTDGDSNRADQDEDKEGENEDGGLAGLSGIRVTNVYVIVFRDGVCTASGFLFIDLPK